MKNAFNILVILGAMVVGYIVWEFVMGNPGNFLDAARHEPKPGSILGSAYTGGYLVAVLIGLLVTSITFVIERLLSITKAKGKGNPAQFIKAVQENLIAGNYDMALEECEKQRGSMANIMRAAIERFKTIENDPNFQNEKKMAEVQRAIDEATNLETPLLEKNLVILSTVASVSTMVGLLGTTIGMIRAFQALGMSGTVSAQALSVGISEALFNTAGGLVAAVISIIAYNFFTTLVDNFVYMIDEAILSLTQILTIRTKK